MIAKKLSSEHPVYLYLYIFLIYEVYHSYELLFLIRSIRI